MKFLNKNKINGLAFLAVMIFLLYPAKNIFAFSDNFESYSTGEFSGQTLNWSTATWDIVTTEANSGVKSVYATTYSEYLTHVVTATSTNIYVEFYLKTNNGDGCYKLRGNTDKNSINQCFTPTGMSPNGGGADVYFNDFTEWTKITLLIDNTIDKFDLYFNDVLKGTEIPFFENSDYIDRVIFYTGGSGNDFFIDDFYIADVNDINSGDTNTVNYDYTLDLSYPDFNSVTSQTCIIGQQCNLWFSFNALAVGYPMYLTYYASSTIPSNAISSTLVTASEFWQNAVTVPAVSTSTEIKYNLLLDGGAYGWTTKTGIIIKWVDGDYWEELLQDKYGADLAEYCAEVVVCDGIATTSSFLYGVQCGMQKTICWTFAPTNNSKKFIINSIKGIEESFPFNLYFTFINRLASIADNQTMTANVLTVPFINNDGEYIMLDVVSSSTMEMALGDSYEIVKTGLISLIWIITSLVISLIVYKAIW